MKENHLYINREFSWLEFNRRVMYEAREEKNPLLERLKFEAIVTSNLEEFFMVRVAVLKKQCFAKLGEVSLDQKTPQEQLEYIRENVSAMIKEQYRIFNEDLIPKLKKEQITIMTEMSEIEKIRDVLHPIYESRIKPVLTPLSVSSTHPFPNLVSGNLYLAVRISPKSEEKILERSELAFIEVPTKAFGRFIKPQRDDVFIPLENVIRLFALDLFYGYEIHSVHIVRITRDADFSIQEDAASDLLKEIETNIKKMHRRSVVKIEYEKGTDPEIVKVLQERYQIQDSDLFKINGILNLKDLFEIAGTVDRDDLKEKPITPLISANFRNKNFFEVMAERNVLLYHPYHAYDPVIEFIHQAAVDPDVLAIKQTLYRTSSKSKIIEALIKAAENGKYVSVIDELKARFDEKRNIESAKKLEDAGAHVTYGVAGLKTHAKSLLVVRKEKDGIKRYMHFGTGNYNESTSKLYTDFSLFTSDDQMGVDASSMFNLLTGFSLPQEWNQLTMAPVDLRQKFDRLIDREINNAQNGMKAKIIAKMNSLSDMNMVNKLYEASQAGVKVVLIVRGICCLIPGVKGMSENITVHSIIGKFLEHARIYYFYNGGKENYFIASADWMMRNLDRRIELLTPVLEEKNQKFLEKILKLQLEDNVNHWVLNSDKTYSLYRKKQSEKNSFDQIYGFISEMETEKDKSAQVQFTPLKSPE